MPFSHEDKILIKHYRLEKRYGWRRIKREFPDKDWSDGGLQALIRKIDNTGDIDRVKGSGRPRTETTEENQAVVEDLVMSQESEPGTHLTQHEIAVEIGTSRSSVQRMIHGLGLRAYKKIKVQKLSDMDKEKRLVRAKRMLRYFKWENVRKTFFTDEKIFKLQEARNVQNDRVYGRSRDEISNERIFVERQKFPSSVMVSVGVSYLGKTSVHFVELAQRINSEYYCNNLLNQLIPEMTQMSGGDFIFQQDGARCHTSAASIKYLEEHVPILLPPEMWPPNSPDLNPLDYGLWEILERMVWSHGVRATTIDGLKARIVQCWEEISQETINNTIGSFRHRIQSVIDANGGHIERFL
jgi:hypothetical protein